MKSSASRRKLEIKAAQSLRDEGWVVDVSIPSVKAFHDHYVSNRHDFFNSFDIIALHPTDGLKLIQVTSTDYGVDTAPTIRSHKMKIEANVPFVPGVIQEIWVYRKQSNGRWSNPHKYIRTKTYGWMGESVLSNNRIPQGCVD
jgi:hypothetical protein